jgi:hypothetical protein
LFIVDIILLKIIEIEITLSPECCQAFSGLFLYNFIRSKTQICKTMIDLSCVSVYNYYSGSSALNGKENKSNNKY